jgi:hypothetical protein
MTKYEYQVIELQPGFLSREPPGLQDLLNEKGNEGWRLTQLLTPAFSGLSKFTLVLERPRQ